MARFYEKYGHAIVWSLTSILGIALVYWLLAALAMHGQVLPGVGLALHPRAHEVVISVVRELVSFVEQRIQWFGALATLATFVFGLVTGIRQAKRQLPRRLVQFMTEPWGRQLVTQGSAHILTRAFCARLRCASAMECPSRR
jgi:hypothetical protein